MEFPFKQKVKAEPITKEFVIAGLPVLLKEKEPGNPVLFTISFTDLRDEHKLDAVRNSINDRIILSLERYGKLVFGNHGMISTEGESEVTFDKAVRALSKMEKLFPDLETLEGYNRLEKASKNEVGELRNELRGKRNVEPYIQAMKAFLTEEIGIHLDDGQTERLSENLVKVYQSQQEAYKR